MTGSTRWFTFDFQISNAWKGSSWSGTRERGWNSMPIEKWRRREFTVADESPAAGTAGETVTGRRQHCHVPRLNRWLSRRRAERRRCWTVTVLRSAVLRMNRVLGSVGIVARQRRAGPMRIRWAQSATWAVSRLSRTGRRWVIGRMNSRVWRRRRRMWKTSCCFVTR